MNDLIKIGLSLDLLGIISLISYQFSNKYVDEHGVLREPFFLLPIALIFLTLGTIFLIIGFSKRKKKSK
ncbi:putative membrane protein [Halobacteriovorax marinus SJ]|uniref:Membrane protein n=1 Tax=Halobacteriovorax marinus (strain ATCC BAA-682 / DSM 15412 / SJ) TaxID=862908 RepID=E1X433_HALMS|nr:DUF3955 domain-containing protein [Halobacteriovorax marinus]CBW25373.1 putative membrane protein [Halobacteriovorax marinus SJ]